MSEQQQVPTKKEWIGLGVLAVGLGLIVLDGTIVSVALPAIISDLNLSLTDAQWVNSLYTVLLAALLLSTGNLADRFGRKRIFLVGVIIFMLGSFFAAVAYSAGTLIASRGVQAVGAALIMPSTLSTVNAVFRGKYRAAAFGVWGAVISGAAALGPLAGGALTQWVSWHWIFLVNLPVGIVVIIAGMLTVTETRSAKKLPGVDVDGALLSAIGFGALVFAVIEGPNLGWWIPKTDFVIFGWSWPNSFAFSVIPVALAISIISLILFIFWEKHRSRVRREALLDLTLFKFPTFSWGNITAAMVAIGEFAILFVLPLYLINALGLNVLHAGFVLAAMAVGAFISGALARHLAQKFGAPGTVMIGLLLEVLGAVILVVVVRGDSAGWLIATPLAIYGLGLGLASAQLTGTVLQDIPISASGQGSATQSTVRQIGAALGTAVAGAALSVALAITLPNSLNITDLDQQDVTNLSNSTRETAGTTIAQIRSGNPDFGDQTDHIISALSDGFADASRWSIGFASIFLILGFIGAIKVRKISRETPIANV